MLSSVLRTHEPRTSTRLGCRLPRKALLAGASLAALVIVSPVANAGCTDNFDFVAINIPKAGDVAPVQELTPLGRGSALSALTSTINTVNTAFLSGTSAFVSAPGNAKPGQVGSGAWGRVVGGTAEINTTSVGTIDVSKLGLVPDTGKQTCDTTVRQDYGGVQFGYDVATLNAGGTGANIHLGFTAGYLAAYTRDITAPGSYVNGLFIFDTPAGSLSVHTEVPFVGAYMAYTNKGFYLDGQLRLDFYQNSFADPTVHSGSFTGQGISLTVNAGQNIQLGSGWFIEPSAGLVVSRVQVDTINVNSTLVDDAGFKYAHGTVTVDDITSILGRATLRIGTAFASQGIVWQPFFAASVFHDFDGDVTAKSEVSGTGNVFIDGLSLTMQSTGGIGTYAQLGLGTSVVLGNSGWLSYGRVDYRTGENIEGWGVNAGLRYQW
jgi:hypothetical protein